jgi:hypothetical protein
MIEEEGECLLFIFLLPKNFSILKWLLKEVDGAGEVYYEKWSIFHLGILIARKALSTEKTGLGESIGLLLSLVIVEAMSSIRIGKDELIVLVLEDISAVKKRRFEKDDFGIDEDMVTFYNSQTL